MAFLPVTKQDMEKRGWDYVDFVLVTGDAYVDHPSFGTSIISRVLESMGYRVAILPQPEYRNCDDFRRFGRPRLGFLINSGNVDSMVNNFSVFKHRRKMDIYAPGGKAGGRPDRALIVYSNRAREAYKDIPIVIGGLEASLRRFSHYDYWDDKVRRSILLDARADILIYGMGERAIIEIAEALDSGLDARDICWIRGTCCRVTDVDDSVTLLPSFEDVKSDKVSYCKSFAMQYRENDCITGNPLAESYGNVYVLQNPPQPPLERHELDHVYELPYERSWHPMYDKDGGIPGFSEVKFSITGTRGCFGGCAFCAITYHQGREVRSRSKESIVNEAKIIAKDKDFKGYIHDVGGPTANFTHPSCRKQVEHGMCKHRDCLFPQPCKQLDVDHSEYLDVLRAVREVEGVKKVFIRSGIRYDYVMYDKDRTFLKELCRNHVSGTLKVAPEHVSDNVLRFMHKPSCSVFNEFTKAYFRTNEKLGMKQYLIPYLISSHPGSTLDDAIDLALYLKEYGFVPDQVQDFYPTPGTLATCIYYTEMEPFTLEPVYVAKNMEEKKMQRSLMHYHKPENREYVKKALIKAGRKDLMDVLVPHGNAYNNRKKTKGKTNEPSKGTSSDSGRRKKRI